MKGGGGARTASAFYDLAQSFAAVAVECLRAKCAGQGRVEYWRAWKSSFFLAVLPLQSALKLVSPRRFWRPVFD